MARKREFEGATLQEALGTASVTLGVPEQDIHYEILETGRRGLFGLGVRAVRIKVELPEQLEADLAPEAESDRRRPRRRERERAPRGRRRGRAGGRRAGARSAGPDKSASPAVAEAATRRAAEEPRDERGGAEPAVARERAAGAPPQAAAEVVATLQRMLDLLSLDLQVEQQPSGDGVRLHLGGADRKMLVAKDAELLFALQFLLNRMARRAWPDAGRIHVGCEGYRSRREEELVELAREVAQQVSTTGEAKRLQPMNPYERRLVHLTVRDFGDLTTRSEGDGFLKRVRIAPK